MNTACELNHTPTNMNLPFHQADLQHHLVLSHPSHPKKQVDQIDQLEALQTSEANNNYSGHVRLNRKAFSTWFFSNVTTVEEDALHVTLKSAK